jgi:hypothetical protein
LCLSQRVLKPIVSTHIRIGISITQALSPKVLPPFVVKVVPLDANDQVVKYDAYARPHYDHLVPFAVDELYPNLFERLERPLQQPYRVLDSYTYLLSSEIVRFIKT